MKNKLNYLKYKDVDLGKNDKTRWMMKKMNEQILKEIKEKNTN